MDLHYKQEATVGALVLTAVALFVLGSMWLSSRSFRTGANTVSVQFADVGNLKRGNAVRISGVQLGSVEEIEFQEVGRVLVTLSLDRQIRAMADATAELASVGLVGDVVINFDPGRSPDPLGEAVIQGQVPEGLVATGEQLADRAMVVLEGLSEVANRQLADDLHATLESIQRLAGAYADREAGPTAQLTASLESLQGLSQRLDSILASPAINRTLTDMDSVTAQVGRLTEQYTSTGARLDTLLQKLNRGEGTLGRAVTDSSLYVELRDLSASLKAFVDDLRQNPGKITVQVKIF